MKKQLTASEVQDVLQRLDSYLIDLKSRWDKENPGNRSWFTIPRNYILKGIVFIVNILDELITFVEPIIPNGSDKKAAVLAICTKLFDYIAVQSFPFWLKPFAGTIKEIAVGMLLSHLIDFIVNKYNSGYWSMTQEAANVTTTEIA